MTQYWVNCKLKGSKMEVLGRDPRTVRFSQFCWSWWGPSEIFKLSSSWSASIPDLHTLLSSGPVLHFSKIFCPDQLVLVHGFGPRFWSQKITVQRKILFLLLIFQVIYNNSSNSFFRFSVLIFDFFQTIGILRLIISVWIFFLIFDLIIWPLVTFFCAYTICTCHSLISLFGFQLVNFINQSDVTLSRANRNPA